MSGPGRNQKKAVISNIAELLTHALALEVEAVARYAELADIMATHNNPEVAGLFMKMSDIEKLHVESIHHQISARKLQPVPDITYQWISAEGPETTDLADLHYLLQPRQALTLALLNEQRAREYYQDILDTTTDQETRSLAGELAVEEEEHVALLQAWQAKFPPAEDDWEHDDDQPNIQD